MLKILIITIKSRIFHLEKFGAALKKLNVDYQVIDDEEYLEKTSQIISNYKKIKKFKKILDEYNPDFVLLDRQSKLGLIILEKNIPLLVTVRGHLWKEEEWAKETLYKSFFGKNLVKRKSEIIMMCLDGAKVILPLSDYLSDIISEYYPNKKIKQLSISSRDPDDWITSKKMKLKHPCIGLLQGANIWGKTTGLINFEKVIQQLPEIMFYWAGDGIYAQKVMDKLKKYKNFQWLGNLQYPDSVKEFLSEIDVYALPTGMDTLGQTIIEASLMGKAIIATNVGGIPEVVEDNFTGYLIDENKYEIWIEKIELMIKDKEKRECFGENGRNMMIKKFNWNETAKKFVEIIHDI